MANAVAEVIRAMVAVLADYERRPQGEIDDSDLKWCEIVRSWADALRDGGGE